jgi:hypothetical protein
LRTITGDSVIALSKSQERRIAKIFARWKPNYPIPPSDLSVALEKGELEEARALLLELREVEGDPEDYEEVAEAFENTKIDIALHYDLCKLAVALCARNSRIVNLPTLNYALEISIASGDTPAFSSLLKLKYPLPLPPDDDTCHFKQLIQKMLGGKNRIELFEALRDIVTFSKWDRGSAFYAALEAEDCEIAILLFKSGEIPLWYRGTGKSMATKLANQKEKRWDDLLGLFEGEKSRGLSTLSDTKRSQDIIQAIQDKKEALAQSLASSGLIDPNLLTAVLRASVNSPYRDLFALILEKNRKAVGALSPQEIDEVMESAILGSDQFMPSFVFKHLGKRMSNVGICSMATLAIQKNRKALFPLLFKSICAPARSIEPKMIAVILEQILNMDKESIEYWSSLLSLQSYEVLMQTPLTASKIVQIATRSDSDLTLTILLAKKEITKNYSPSDWALVIGPSLEEATAEGKEKTIKILREHGEISKELQEPLPVQTNPSRQIIQMIHSPKKTPQSKERFDQYFMPIG